MLPPLPHGIFAPEGDLGTAHDWEVRNPQGRGSLVHRLRGGGEAAGAHKGDVAPQGGSRLSPILAGVSPHGAGLRQGGPAPAQPLLDVPQGSRDGGTRSRPGYGTNPMGAGGNFLSRHLRAAAHDITAQGHGHATGAHQGRRGTLTCQSKRRCPLSASRESGKRDRHGRGETR